MLVSIFIASSTSRMSPVCRLCPTWAATRTTMPETGLRQTLSSFTGLLSAGGATGRGAGRNAQRRRTDIQAAHAVRRGRGRLRLRGFDVHFVCLSVNRDVQFHESLS